MPTYTVHEPPQPPADRIDRAASLVFVKDGFSWAAAVFAPLWLLVHRLWWPLLGYVVLSAVFEAIDWVAILNPGWMTLAIVALHLLTGFEADTLRRWKLDRDGWPVLGSVSGRSAAECERRFYDEWLPSQPVIAPAGNPGPSPRTNLASPRKTPVLGTLLGIRS
jgi:Protein of unknown function (DUF2628)